MAEIKSTIEDLGDEPESVKVEEEQEKQTVKSPKEEDDSKDSSTERENPEEIEVELRRKHRKKRNRKPASKRGLGKPTGFEEYNADGPLSPEEAQQNNLLYNPQHPFAVRIMTAIQRYETRRRMQSEARDVFYKYLAYGGVDVGPNMFQGLSLADRKDLDKDDLVVLLAQTSISDDKLNVGQEDSMWVVDFEGMMKAFLSRRVLQLYELPTEDSIKDITNLLSNFMSYLLLHDVCPEYTNDITSTRKFLDTVAPWELWNIKRIQKWLPGDFNIACSTLFGGFYAKTYNADIEWHGLMETDAPIFVGMKDDEARNVVKFGIAAAASEQQTYIWLEYANSNTAKVESKEKGGFEITHVFPVTEDTKKFYQEFSPGFRPVGRVLAKKWQNPWSLDEDMFRDERKLTKSAHQIKDKDEKNTTSTFDTASSDYEFFVEAQVLQFCFPGLKVEATIYKLNCGIMFFDNVLNVYCGFDTFLPNDLMLDYVKPRAAGVIKAEQEAKAEAEAAAAAAAMDNGTQLRKEVTVEDEDDVATVVPEAEFKAVGEVIVEDEDDAATVVPETELTAVEEVIEAEESAEMKDVDEKELNGDVGSGTFKNNQS